MKKLSIAILSASMFFSAVSFADMDGRDDREEEHQKHRSEMKAKMKEICKTDKEKCRSIKEKRKQHKAEMEALING